MSARAPETAGVQARLEAVLGQLAEARRSIGRGEAPELGDLAGEIETLRDELVTLSEDQGALAPAMLALLDELGGLSAQLAAEHANLGAKLRTTDAHQKAGRAYRHKR